MDYLREGIHLRGFAQIEPLVAYKNEAFELFGDLMNSIWGDFARMIFHVQVTVEGRRPAAPPPPPPPTPRRARGRAPRPAAAEVTLLRRRRAAGRAWRWPPRPAAPAARTVRRGTRRCRRAPCRAAPRRRERADRAQRPVLVRVGQEVQEVPRRLSAVATCPTVRPPGLRSAARAGRPGDPRALRRRPPERGRARRARAAAYAARTESELGRAAQADLPTLPASRQRSRRPSCAAPR